ncbi:MAG: (E)-4-hydroxy-3-methylbut-2-enyl-diphosphate synthase [Porphyromonas sp.]|nr:(E)-4-hydroxy-3-methylbut-2-enyl-diphosphate synthase [Porphyromonas sp.]
MSRKQIIYRRRISTPVRVGNITIGGDAEIVVQSMANVNTMDTEASVAQAQRIAEAGGQIVRFTAQGVRESNNLKAIRSGLHEKGCDIPLVADIHFNPAAAYAAAATVQKVRINPGNFVDPARKFISVEYTEEEYAQELEKIEEVFGKFLDLCIANGTAIRLGVNHGSLSDRIMTRFGNTPEGMVESCMEYLRVCRKKDFHDVVISIKSSNTAEMTTTVRLLIKRMDAEDMHYPLHLGVTEAGDGEDGRVKSAVGIGSLLADGIGDTIRVSLSEEPEDEIPVANTLVACAKAMEQDTTPIYTEGEEDTTRIALVKDRVYPVVVTRWNAELPNLPASEQPDYILAEEDTATIPEEWRDRILNLKKGYREMRWDELLNLPDEALSELSSEDILLVSFSPPTAPRALKAVESRLSLLARNTPLIARLVMPKESKDILYTQAGFYLGGWLLSRNGAGLMIDVEGEDHTHLAFSLLQASRRRITKTEYISCPGCGRTLFALQSTVARVKAATEHLKGLKIGVMGCIVNGPGEMADADYGYVGAGPGKIDLYKEKNCVAKGIPQDEAVEKLVQLIKDSGDWQEPD